MDRKHLCIGNTNYIVVTAYLSRDAACYIIVTLLYIASARKITDLYNNVDQYKIPICSMHILIQLKPVLVSPAAWQIVIKAITVPSNSGHLIIKFSGLLSVFPRLLCLKV